MKRVAPQPAWPLLWRKMADFDDREIYGNHRTNGHAYYYQSRFATTFRLIEEAIPPGAEILDIAAAGGNYSLSLAERGYRVVWNDIRSDLEGYVRLKYESGDITYAPGNAFELGFDGRFDCILIGEIIEHVAHPDEFLSAVSHMARPGGRIVMTTPNGAYFRNRLPRFSQCPDPSAFESVQFRPDGDGHIFLLWRDEIEAFAMKIGLRIEKHAIFNTPLTNGHPLSDRALRWLSPEIVERGVARLPERLRDRLLMHLAFRFARLA